MLVPVALATAALTLGVALPGGKPTAVLEPPPANAATLLTSLRDKVAGAPAEHGRYAYLKQISYTSHMGSDYVAVIPHEYEQWVADDGTGVVEQIIHWDQADVPDVRGQAGLRGAAAAAVLDDSPQRQRARRGARDDAWRRCGRCPPTRWRSRPSCEHRDNVVVTAYAGALLSFAGTPHAVKVALFSVLKSVPGAKLIPSVTDPLKRTGVGVQFDDEAWRTLFLFDPDTGALLGTQSIGKQGGPRAHDRGLEPHRRIGPDGHRARDRALTSRVAQIAHLQAWCEAGNGRSAGPLRAIFRRRVLSRLTTALKPGGRIERPPTRFGGCPDE